MSHTRWGALVARALPTLPLLAACSAPPAAVPPTPPVTEAPSTAPALPPEPPPSPSTPDPAGTTAGLGPATVVLRLASESYRHYQRGIRFGGGFFVHVGAEIGADLGDPPCSLPDLKPPRCTGFRIAPWSDRATQERWPQIAGATVKDWGPWIQTEHDWRHFSPGQKGVYAARGAPEGKTVTVDFIDEKGARREAFSSDQFTDALVIETPAGLRMIGPDGNGKLRFASIKDGKPTDLRDLGIGDIPAMDDAFSVNARSALEGSKFAAYGPWRAVLLPPEKAGAEPAIALVWVDVIPPRKISRARNQCARPSVAEFEKITREMAGHGSSNECSAGGRLLSSRWARKRLHVTRLTLQGERIADHVSPLPAEYNAATRPLDLRLEGNKLLIDDRSFDLEKKTFDRGKEAPVALGLEGPARLAIASAAFDPASGEGIVLFRKATSYWSPGEEKKPSPFLSQRFDALGKATGPLVEVPERPFNSAGAPTLARAAGRWHQRVSPRNHEGSMAVLEVGKGPEVWRKYSAAAIQQKICELGHHCSSTPSFLGLAASPDGKGVSQYTFQRPDSIIEGTSVVPDDGGEIQSETRTWPGHEPEEGVATLPPSVTADMALRGRPLFQGGKLLATPGGKAIAMRRSPKTKRLLIERGEGWALAPGWPEEGEASYTFHEVWDDLVLVVVAADRATATWLRRGKSVELSPEVRGSIAPGREPGLPTGEGGPVLPGGRWALPASPGPALPLPEEAVALRPLCPVIMATGPRRALLACTEPAAPNQPAAVLTLRPLRY